MATRENDHLLGYCGLYCGGCRMYQDTQKHGKAELEPGNFVACGGCASEQTTPWCTDCAIKSCAREKDHRHCLLCADFPCDKMTGFMQDPKYPYHQDVPANMRRLVEIGFEDWCAEMEQRWHCKECGGQCNWFEKKCSQCGADLS